MKRPVDAVTNPGVVLLPFESREITDQPQTISVSPSHGTAAFVINKIKMGTSAWRVVGLRIEGRPQLLEGPFDPCPIYGWINVDVEYHSEHAQAGGLCRGVCIGDFADPADTTIVHRVGPDTERNIAYDKLAREQAKQTRRLIARRERRHALLVVLGDISRGGSDGFRCAIDGYLKGSQDALEAWLDTLAANDEQLTST